MLFPTPLCDTGATDKDSLHVGASDSTESQGKLMLHPAINTVQYENDDARYSNNVRQWIPNNVHFQNGQIQYSATCRKMRH